MTLSSVSDVDDSYRMTVIEKIKGLMDEVDVIHKKEEAQLQKRLVSTETNKKAVGQYKQTKRLTLAWIHDQFFKDFLSLFEQFIFLLYHSVIVVSSSFSNVLDAGLVLTPWRAWPLPPFHAS